MGVLFLKIKNMEGKMRDFTILKYVSLFIFAVLFFYTNSSYGQATGSIGGSVLNEKDNSPLVGAVVKISGSNQGAVTDDNGEYVILNVDVGTYSLEASYVGYDMKIFKNIRVSVDQRTKVFFTLKETIVSTEIIIIEGERKGIDVEQSGRVIENTTINNSGVRGITNIVSKTAGVVQDERGGAINIRGGRSNESIVIVDGVETTNPLDGSSRAFIPNNLLQEITVLTGGFGAEYGNVLSGVINVSTRTGTDKFTGSLELISDDFYPGRWFNTLNLGYNLYNFTIGGPIVPTTKLAKVFNFFGSFERYFMKMPVASWILDKDPTIIPNGKLKNDEAGSYSYNGRFNVNLTELPNGGFPINLRMGLSVNQSTSKVLYGSNIYGANGIDNSDRNPISMGNDYQYFVRLIHTVIPNKFLYELQGSYFRVKTEQFDPIFKDNLTWYGDTAHNPLLTKYGYVQGGNLGLDPNLFSLYARKGRVIDFYSKSDISYVGAKLDATYSLLTKKFGDHEVKFGGEIKYHTLKNMSLNPGTTADLSISNSFDRWFGTNTSRLKTYGFRIVDPLTGTVLTEGDDAKHPITGGLYIRDKVSFSDFNFNGGLRIDFMDVNTKVLRDIEHDLIGPDGQLVTDDDFVDSKMDVIFSPRLGFSFPITNDIIFVAQYGKMVQLPQLNLLFVSPVTLQRFLSTALQDVIENSSLKPTKLTQYEIGFKQKIGNFIDLGVTAFYKEAIDLIGAGRVKRTDDGKVPNGFVTYMNLDFAISRGLDFYLSMRRNNRLAIDLAYTLSYASGTGSDPYSKNSLANNSDAQLPNYVFSLDYDQRHTGNVNLDYRFGDVEDVPKGILGHVLRNLGLNILFSFNSGRPYTGRTVSNTATGTSGEFITTSKNELYMDWHFRIDLKIDKMVNIWKTNWTFYAYVINLLNTEIINYVFPGTGKPDDNGFTRTPTGAQRYRDYALFRQLWPERIKFLSNWGPPRQIRFGVNINF
jgi:outer membrane receptor protein involved in Fe transport